MTLLNFFQLCTCIALTTWLYYHYLTGVAESVHQHSSAKGIKLYTKQVMMQNRNVLEEEISIPLLRRIHIKQMEWTRLISMDCPRLSQSVRSMCGLFHGCMNVRWCLCVVYCMDACVLGHVLALAWMHVSTLHTMNNQNNLVASCNCVPLPDSLLSVVCDFSWNSRVVTGLLWGSVLSSFLQSPN